MSHEQTSETEKLDTGSLAPSPHERSLERALGARIRTHRQALDLSLADLSGAAGISTGMLSKIENGVISPSLTTLQALSASLRVSLSSLFAASEERHDCSHVKAGKGLLIDRRGTKVGHIYHLLGHMLGGDIRVEPYLITLAENATIYTDFTHAGVEFIYMLEGSLAYRHGNSTYQLDEGDSLLFDSASLHGPEKVGEGATRYLSVIIYPGS